MRAPIGRLLLPILVVVVLLTGCFTVPENGDDDPVDGDDPLTSFRPRTLYLDEETNLTADPPEDPGSVPAGDFVLKWTTGIGEHPRFEEALSEGSLHEWISAQNASVTLYLTTDQPVLPAEGALPDVAVWLGSSHHTPLVGSTQLDGPLMPDEVVPVTFDLPGPENQPAILALEGISLIVTITMTQSAEHNVRILTGGEHASFVTFETRPLMAQDVEGADELELETREISGELLLFDRFLGITEEGLNYADHEIQIDESTMVLLAFVQVSGGAHTVDMDMVLLDEQGETITWGVTPYAHELLWLVGPNLDPYRGQTLSLRVMNHLGLLMEFEGIIQTG